MARHLAVLIFPLVGLVAPSQTSSKLSKIDQESLQMTVTQLKDAILHDDIQKVLTFISKTNGLTCTDTKYSYDRISNFLKDKNSHLYLSLFDSSRFSKLCGSNYSPEYPAISEKEFFTRATNTSIDITSPKNGWAFVVYKSQTKGHYQREWTFHKENGQWKIAEGFIIGNCSCG